MSDDNTSKKDNHGAINNAGVKNSTGAKNGSGSKKTPGKKAATTNKSKNHDKSVRDSASGSAHGSIKYDSKTPGGSKVSFFISGFMLVAIAISMAGIIMLWQQQQTWQKEEQKNQQQLHAQSQLISVLESEIKKYAGAQDQLRNELDNKVTTEINEIERSIADIKELGSKNVRDWVLSESEYLLQIANHRLQLEGDINTARKVLRIVDSKIMSLEDPSLLPVRKQLADEISALESTHLPDIHGMVLNLDSLQAMSSKMMLKISLLPRASQKTDQENNVEELSIEDWRLALDKVWDELKTLVIIKRHDQLLAPVLTVEQQQALRHILQLKIQGIRTALLNKQAELFMESIKDTLSWLQEHFNKDDPNVVLLESRLQEFKVVQLDVKLPDISGSLRSLRSIQKQMNDRTGSIILPKKSTDTSNISEKQDEKVKT